MVRVDDTGASNISTPLADVVTGSTASDILTGLAGNDLITGAAGNDNITGGTGIDTSIYSGLAADYTITQNLVYQHYPGMTLKSRMLAFLGNLHLVSSAVVATGSFVVHDNNPADGNDGTDTVTDIEKLKFSDQIIDLVT